MSAFFLWLKHCLSDLPLTGPLYSTVFLKHVWLHTAVKLHTVQVFYALCTHAFYNPLHTDVKNRVKMCFRPRTSHIWFMSPLFCLLDKKVKWMDKNAKQVCIIVSNPCHYQIREAALTPLDWKWKYFLFGWVVVIETSLSELEVEGLGHCATEARYFVL